MIAVAIRFNRVASHVRDARNRLPLSSRIACGRAACRPMPRAHIDVHDLAWPQRAA